jgi:uncharacterized protein
MLYNKPMLASLKRILLALLGFYVLLCIALYFEQSRLIFFPEREVLDTPKHYGCDFQDVQFGGIDGQLQGWWLSAEPRLSVRMGSRTLIYFHGNGGNIGDNAEHACRLRNLGLNVFIFDYRGYGMRSGARPSEKSVFQDADSAWTYLTGNTKLDRAIDPRKIIIYGHSLGGAVAIETANRHPESAALIVESTFTSIRAMAERDRSFRFFPLALILNQKMDSLDKIRSIRMPVLFIHGTADRIVPTSMSEQLYAAAPGPKQLYLVEGAGHENCAATAGEAYQQHVLKFLSTVPEPAEKQLSLTE